jgi:C-terminal processing protease CtpA/Prc
VFFVGGVTPRSKADALNVIRTGDVIASIDGHVLSSRESVEDAVRMIDEPMGTVAHVLLLREVPGTGVVNLTLSFHRFGEDNGWNFDSDQAGDSLYTADHASPRSYTSSSSLYGSGFGPAVRRHRPFNSLGSFDTQISTPQLSPRGQRMSPIAFNDVRDIERQFSQPHSQPSIAANDHETTPIHCGVGLMLRQLSKPGQQLHVVVGELVPGGSADESKRFMLGDALLSVDGCSVSILSSLDEVASIIMGPIGTHVVLQMHRALTNSTYTVTLVRKVRSD